MTKTLSAALAMAVVLAVPVTANAHVVAHWKMNENRGTHLHDSSGHGQGGRIGKAVDTVGDYHRFSRLPLEDHGTTHPGHIDRVPDSRLLDPGRQRFSVTVRFQWAGSDDRNLIQKGQGSPAGGMFKMKTSVGADPPGMIKCLFRGGIGDSTVNSSKGRRLDDDKWHTVTCTRNAHGTRMRVDGSLLDRNPKHPGRISNDWPVTIGGNVVCDGGTTSRCNYWWGRIGDVKWRVG